MTPEQCCAFMEEYNTAGHATYPTDQKDALVLWAMAELYETAAVALLTARLYRGAPSLYDAETGRYLGPASLEQCAASARATVYEEQDGIFCVDGCGGLVELYYEEENNRGCWRSRRALPVTLVYVRAMCAE